MDLSNQMYIVGLGEVLWDVLPDGRKLGGAPANFAYHVSQCGMPAYLVSAVGDDALGEEIRSTLKEKGLNTILPTVPHPTGTVDVELDEAGVPRYNIRENVAWDNIPFTPEIEELARHTVAVCFGTLAQRGECSRQTIEKYLATMPEECIRICDLNLRGHYYDKEVIEASMRACDVLKVNEEELQEVCRVAEIEYTGPHMVGRDLMTKYNMEMLILTCGENGSYIYCEDESASAVPTPKVEVVDTVGAGDAFTAAFVSGMLGGLELRWAHLLAVETASFVCTQAGAMPELPQDIKDKV